MNLSTPLSRLSLHEELVMRLRQAIVDGTLEPQAKVPERELYEQLGVSCTPLREALKVLANEGPIILESNRGARVSNVAVEELEAAFPVVAVLEGLAGELACAKATDDEVAQLVDRHHDMFRHYDGGDRPDYFKAKRDTHNMLFETARNPVLTQHYTMAPIRSDRIFDSGADVPVFDCAGIELEVGFEVMSTIPARADLTQIAKALRPRPVIEVVDTRIAGPLVDDPIVKLADQQASGALVIGDPLTSWDRTDFTRVTGDLVCGDTIVLRGESDVPGGSALSAVQTLADMIGDHCGGLQPGMIVITGSLNGVPCFPAGTKVCGKIEGLGVVNLQLSK